MKKIIPFTKSIDFETPIAEITDIEATHNLVVKENNCIEGSIIVDGAYKKYEATTIEDNFHYDLPFTIEVDNKYNIEEGTIAIKDFYFEIEDEILKINMELEIGNVFENEIRESSIEIPVDIEEPSKIELEPYIDLDNEKKEEEFLEMINNNQETKKYPNMFNSISSEETFVTYYVYIFKENDNIEEIINKYNITKEDLELYNDLNNIQKGSKIIIPCPNE